MVGSTSVMEMRLAAAYLGLLDMGRLVNVGGVILVILGAGCCEIVGAQ